jgi:CBS domain-containing protein
MRKNEPIRKLMSTELVTIHHGGTVSQARKTMLETGVHHLPVVSGDELLGIISWSDLLRVSFGDAFGTDDRAVDATLDHTFTLEQVMSGDPITVVPQTTVHAAAEILCKGQFHCLPVVEDGKLVGMVTTSDLLRYLAELY